MTEKSRLYSPVSSCSLLRDRHVVVTGSSGGIGSALAQGLSAAGARVSGLDIAETAEHRCDVRIPAQVTSTIDAIAAEHGPVDSVVMAAGRFPNRPLEQWTLTEMEELWRLNVGGCFNVVQACLSMLRASKRGRVVAISSSAVLQGVPGFTAYASSKAALVGFVRSLAAELGPDGATANVVTPGLTATAAALHGDVAPFFDPVVAGQMIQRRLRADDLVGAVQFLCSDASSMVTGQILNIDGGTVTH